MKTPAWKSPLAILAMSMIASSACYERGAGQTGTLPTLSATPQILKTVSTMKVAYPELSGFSARRIPAVYTPVVLAAPRPVAAPKFLCGSAGYSQDWRGLIPPNCTDTGSFYRVYSRGLRAAAESIVVLPSVNGDTTELPITNPATASGYVYIEGWPGARSSNSEGGLHYNAGSRRYTPYIASPGKPEHDASWSVMPGTQVYIRVASDENPTDKATLPQVDRGRSCLGGCILLTVAILPPACPEESVCVDQERELSTGWKANCCIFGLMTSIARTEQFTFSGDYRFGPITWERAYTETELGADKYRYDGCSDIVGSQCRTAAFSQGGAQLYPNSQTYFNVLLEETQKRSVTVLNP